MIPLLRATLRVAKVDDGRHRVAERLDKHHQLLGLRLLGRSRADNDVAQRSDGGAEQRRNLRGLAADLRRRFHPRIDVLAHQRVEFDNRLAAQVACNFRQNKIVTSLPCDEKLLVLYRRLPAPALLLLVDDDDADDAAPPVAAPAAAGCRAKKKKI